ncbi:MAG: peptidylprolyl isomerase [Eubacteriales bacterium]|nr:peptidylprolyl isomerase [Eubacteriales bacterium]
MSRAKRCIGAVMAAVLLAGTASGCGNTRLVVTTGLAADELFRIGTESCRLSEALVYLINEKNQYETVYGIEMWDHKVGDVTLEEYLKDQVVSQLSQVKSMVLLAKEQEIALSEEETGQAARAAAQYYGSLTEEEIRALKTDQEQLQGMYEDYCLADKAYEQITGDAAVEISDDEARIIEIQQIFVPEADLAGELKTKLDAGEDFESIAANYSRAAQTTVTMARGEKDETYEEVAFRLDNGEISEVFADDGGYYILRCVSTYMEEESEANKEKVALQRKTERFQEIYSGLMEDTLSEFQEKLWEGVDFADYADTSTSGFFETYQEYFE